MAKLNKATKLMYGLGFTAQGIKDSLFQVFLFFYFNQVLGLDPALSGAAAIIALVFDAVSDPVIGVLSDQWKSAKWGRRHPFMFWSALPLAITTYLLFIPPVGLGQMGLFAWLTIFAILVRLSLTLLLVPGMSLGAELTPDYDERTSVTSYRIMFSSFLGPLVMIFGLLTYFAPTPEFTNGLFNAAAYPPFVFICSIIIALSILISTWGTRSVIPSLPVISPEQEKGSMFDIFKQFKHAFSLKEFRTLLSYIGVVYIGIGIGMMLSTYLLTFYFELKPDEFAVLLIAPALAGLLAVFISPKMGASMGKKKAAIWSSVGFAFFFALPINLRLLGLFVDNDSPYLLLIYALSLIVAYIFLWTALSISSSMMADVADAYELESGERHEGLFFSALSFAYKCSVGLGSFFGGLLLKIIAFPVQTEAGDVAPEAILGLGIVAGPVIMVFYLCSIYFIWKYPITKEKYAVIRAALESRKANTQN